MNSDFENLKDFNILPLQKLNRKEEDEDEEVEYILDELIELIETEE